MNEKFDITKIFPKLYSTKQGSIEVVDVPMLRILAINGEGSINSPRFVSSMDALYSSIYAILQMPKEEVLIDDFIDFKISPLEVMWSMKNGKDLDISNRDNCNWELFSVVPGFVTQKIVNMAVSRISKIKPNDRYSDLHISSLQEKKSVQTLHIGSFSTISNDLEKLKRSIKRRGYKASSRYHEIFLNDPTMKSSRLKTLLRQPVIKI